MTCVHESGTNTAAVTVLPGHCRFFAGGGAVAELGQDDPYPHPGGHEPGLRPDAGGGVLPPAAPQHRHAGRAGRHRRVGAVVDAGPGYHAVAAAYVPFSPARFQPRGGAAARTRTRSRSRAWPWPRGCRSRPPHELGRAGAGPGRAHADRRRRPGRRDAGRDSRWRHRAGGAGGFPGDLPAQAAGCHVHHDPDGGRWLESHGPGHQ